MSYTERMSFYYLLLLALWHLGCIQMRHGHLKRENVVNWQLFCCNNLQMIQFVICIFLPVFGVLRINPNINISYCVWSLSHGVNRHFMHKMSFAYSGDAPGLFAIPGLE